MTDATNSDGSGSVARESKFALITQFVLGVAATGAIGWLGTLNVSTLPGWATTAATLAVTTAVGFLTAYVTKNKVTNRVR
jgi:hypothetical protein